jgi:fibrillarin-like pre-rRNA processing protein
MSKKMKRKSESGWIRIGKNIATKNVWKQRVYDEQIIRIKGQEYRIWNPRKSKLAAAILNGLKNFPVKKGTKILYLGVASGTTASHLSDIVDKEGIIYGVEFSPRALRDLMLISKKRWNIAPILADARIPESYISAVEKAEVLYADIAQPDQAEIVMRNAELFLKKNGWLMMAVKARSIDVSKKPKEVFREVRRKLESMFEIKEEIRLEPFEKDHVFMVGRMR